MGRRLARTLATLAIALVAGCLGGGSGGSTSLSPPRISGLYISPTGAYVGSGPVTITGSLTYRGANGGAASLRIVVLDAGGQTISDQSTAISGGAGFPDGSLYGEVFVATTDVAQTYTFRVTITDYRGLTSNPLQGTFRVTEHPYTEGTVMPHPRDGAAVAESDGLVYVIGGMPVGTSAGSAIVDVYDPVTDSWSDGVPMPTARTGAVAAAIAGKIYVIGGQTRDYGVKLGLVEVFDTVAGTWSMAAPMPTPRFNAAAAVLDGEVCVAGGNEDGALLKTFECYDPAADAWNTRTPMGNQRQQFGAVVIDGAFYAVGGFGNFLPESELERYNPVTDTWSALGAMYSPNGGGSAAALGGRLYDFGGSWGGLTSKAAAYDPATGTWTPRTDLPAGALLFAGGAAVVGDAIYLFDRDTTLRYVPGNDLR